LYFNVSVPAKMTPLSTRMLLHVCLCGDLVNANMQFFSFYSIESMT
jgi:hypothetical protein